jgi:steroid delta-isomerase-like uncharacterized protein
MTKMSKGTDFVRNWFEAFNRGDLEAMVAMCHPDVELSNSDGSYRGHDGVRAAFKPILDSGSEWDTRVNNVIDAGDTVVAEFVLRGRHTKPLVTSAATIPPTNKMIDLPSIGIYELRDGKLAASRGAFDRMTLLVQLGLMPAPTAVR